MLLLAVMITLDVALLQTAIAVILPGLVDIVTNSRASSALKTLVNLLLSAISAVLVQIVHAGGTFDLRWALLLLAWTFIVSVTSHTAIWKPSGASAAVTSATASFGLGPAT